MTAQQSKWIRGFKCKTCNHLRTLFLENCILKIRWKYSRHPRAIDKEIYWWPMKRKFQTRDKTKVLTESYIRGKASFPKVWKFPTVLEKETWTGWYYARCHGVKTQTGQAWKSTWWMPWHWEPKKDVISCDKRRGGANIHWSDDFWMGKPSWINSNYI